MASNSYIAPTTQPNLDFARCAALTSFNSNSYLAVASYFDGYIYTYDGTQLVPAFGIIPNIFGSWVYAALGGLPPSAYANGGAQFVSGATGYTNWVTDAYTGIYGLEVQTINGGTMIFNSLLPSLNYTITGTETFTAYIKLLDTAPGQIELEFYASGSWNHRVYLGTDYFNSGSSTNVGAVPNVANQWSSFTFTAANLGLTVGQVITGIGWGVWQNNNTCTVVFSNITTYTSNSIVVPNIQGYIDCTQDGSSGFYVLPFSGELYYTNNIGSGVSAVAALPSGSTSFTGMKYDSVPYIIDQSGIIYDYVSGSFNTITLPPSGVTAPARFLATDGASNLYTIFSSSNELATYNIPTSGWTLKTSPFTGSLDALAYTVSGISIGGSNTISFSASGVVGGTINSSTDQLLVTNGTNIEVWDFETGGWALNSTVSGAGDPTNIACNNNNNALVSNPTANIIQQLNYSAGVWLSTNLSITDPTGIAITPDGLHAIICQPSQNQVSILNNSLGTWSVGQTIAISNSPNTVSINSTGTYACIGTTVGLTFLKFNLAEWVLDTSIALSSAPSYISIDSSNTSNNFFYVASISGSTTTISVYNNDIFVSSYNFSGVISSLLVVDYQIFAPLTNGNINIGICISTGQTSNSTQNSITPNTNTIALWYPDYILLSSSSNIQEYYIVQPFTIAQSYDAIIATLSGSTWLTADLQNRSKVSSLTNDVSGRVIATTINNEIYRILDYTTIDSGYTFVLTPPNGQQTNTSIGTSKSTYFNNSILSSTSLYGGLIEFTG